MPRKLPRRRSSPHARHRAACAGWHLPAPPHAGVLPRAWLRRGDALTGHLRQYGPVRVRVHREAAVPADADEAAALGLPPGARVWMRIITLLMDGQAVVLARSVTPWRHRQATWRAMRSLGTLPLASILYHDPEVTRSGLASRALPPRHRLARLAAQLGLVGAGSAQALLARRSVFVRRGAPLLIAECFLPAAWARLREQAPAC